MVAKSQTQPPIELYFTDVYGVSEEALEEYGAFNISLIVDLPLFVDPFLLFNSSNPTYQALHAQIIDYLKYLRDAEDRSEPVQVVCR
jgi:hypothetical protein